MKKIITKNKWVQLPHPAHFICSRDCRFVLATKIGKYIVSTVGELWQDSISRRIHASIFDKEWYTKNSELKGDNFDDAYYKKFGYEKLGSDRTYETMVFKCMRDKKNLCCGWKIASGSDIDFCGYNTAEEARKGHDKLCVKWSKK